MSLPEATGELTSGPEVAVSTTMSFLVGGGLGLLGYGLGFRLNDLGFRPEGGRRFPRTPKVCRKKSLLEVLDHYFTYFGELGGVGFKV